MGPLSPARDLASKVSGDVPGKGFCKLPGEVHSRLLVPVCVLTLAIPSGLAQSQADLGVAVDASERNTSGEPLGQSPPSDPTGQKVDGDPRGADNKEQDQEQASQNPDDSNFVFRYLRDIFGAPDNPREPRFVIYPVVAYSPETSWEFGLSFVEVHYANNDPANRLSEVTAYAYATLAAQFGLSLEHAIYTHQDQWFFFGEAKFQSFPLLYYGIGPETGSEPLAEVDELTLLIRERLLLRLVDSIYFGPELFIDYKTDVQFNWKPGVEPVPPRGAEGSFNLALGMGLVFDNRHNVLNVREGLFSELAFLHSTPTWGSDFGFTVLESDTRYFLQVNARDTVGFQLFGRASFGDVPFNELSTLGGKPHAGLLFGAVS